MSPTPSLPAWITHAHVDGYVNAHQMLPVETRLYGTESLYGDWSGRVLLLAKDFAPSKVLRTRLAKGDARPYRHEPGLRTNVRRERMAGRFQTGGEPETCGLLYGSALANLLRDDETWSGTLPNRREATPGPGQRRAGPPESPTKSCLTLHGDEHYAPHS